MVSRSLGLLISVLVGAVIALTILAYANHGTTGNLQDRVHVLEVQHRDFCTQISPQIMMAAELHAIGC